jgi:hypothetical protein
VSTVLYATLLTHAAPTTIVISTRHHHHHTKPSLPPQPINPKTQHHEPKSHHINQSTLPNSRTRVLVARRDRVVYINQKPRIRSLVATRQRDSRARSPRAAARDGDLSARNIELGAVGRRGGVDGDVLRAQQVVAGGERFGDRKGERVAVLRGEVDGAAAEGGAEFGDFEPRRAAVGGGGGGDFGHVEGWRREEGGELVLWFGRFLDSVDGYRSVGRT